MNKIIVYEFIVKQAKRLMISRSDTLDLLDSVIEAIRNYDQTLKEREYVKRNMN